VGSETDPGDQRIGELTQLRAAALSRIEIAKKQLLGEFFAGFLVVDRRPT